MAGKTVTVSSSTPPERITITTEMARAINAYVGTKIIEDRYVGREIFQGLKSDGEVGIDIESGPTPGNTNFRRFLKKDGLVRDSCSRTPYTTPDGSTFDHYGDKYCTSEERTVSTSDRYKATILIGALFGFGEAQHSPTPADLNAARSLRLAMGLEKPSVQK